MVSMVNWCSAMEKRYISIPSRPVADPVPIRKHSNISVNDLLSGNISLFTQGRERYHNVLYP